MDKKIKKIIIFLGIIFAFFLKAGSVLAAMEVPLPGLGSNADIGAYVCYLFGLGTSFAGGIALVVIVVGGVYYLISFGSGKIQNEGKEWVKAGILGLLIIVCSTLIIYTINPDLSKCKIGALPKFNINSTERSSDVLPVGPDITTYQEIPIGILTENLLTKKMDCYGFDQEGNPIDGEKARTEDGKNINLQTYLDHDRADCINLLLDGAQKTAGVIASLSDEITKLMGQCNCAGKCDDTCGGSSGCSLFGHAGQAYGAGGECSGSCQGKCCGAKCTQSSGNDCCPADVKNKIEHGMIDVRVDVGVGNSDDTRYYDENTGRMMQQDEPGTEQGSCKTDASQYWGLDEFRCNPRAIKTLGPDGVCSGIPALVEKTYKLNSADSKKFNRTYVTVIQKDKWSQLTLLEQLKYFQEKEEEINKTIQDDIDVLDKAGAQLSSCYLAIPYIDLLKTYETTKKTENIIFKEDSYTSATKYCKGFNYNNSTCLKKCDDACPDASSQALSAYSGCQKCPKGGEACLKAQEECIEKAYNKRPCLYGDGTSSNFKDCISSCQNDCANNCSKNYLPCSVEFESCQSHCQDNSQCVLDNAGECLFGAEQFIGCTGKITDQGNSNYCIAHAYLCKNGSDQYAGYSDCVTPTQGCSTDQYSSSFLYDNQNCQKCTEPGSPAEKGTTCYGGANSKAPCQEICPETSKCPSSSYCPNCPCDEIDKTLKFYVPNISVAPAEAVENCGHPAVPDPGNAGKEGYSVLRQPTLSYQAVGPECSEPSYNDDPLTFYCEGGKSCTTDRNCTNGEICSTDTHTCIVGSGKSCNADKDCPTGTGEICDTNIGRCVRGGQYTWITDPKNEGDNPVSIGTDRACSKEGEVPMGQTIEDAENWAKALMKNKLEDEMSMLFSQMRGIGLAKDTAPIQDYCKCNAEFFDTKPVCRTDCQYWETHGEDGTECGCDFVPCLGSPCQQVIGMLSQLWNSIRQFKLDYISFSTTMFLEEQPRSDILKELTYSRKMASSCSLKDSAYGANSRLISCTRAEDETCPPGGTDKITYQGKTIDNYCYGKELGKIFNKPLIDNWFCAEQFEVNPAPSTNPIYNIEKE